MKAVSCLGNAHVENQSFIHACLDVQQSGPRFSHGLQGSDACLKATFWVGCFNCEIFTTEFKFVFTAVFAAAVCPTRLSHSSASKIHRAESACPVRQVCPAPRTAAQTVSLLHRPAI